jgi:hypothetical protein
MKDNMDNIAERRMLILHVFIYQVLVLLITLPLHLIPIFGTVVACYINGWVAWWVYFINVIIVYLLDL